MATTNCVIQSVAMNVPPRVVTNHELEKYMDTSNEWIIERTGIEERRWAEDDVTTTDLALPACEEAIKKAGIEKSEIDMVVAATLSPDLYFPGIGTMIQDKLGLNTVPGIDIRAQCSGFVYGLATSHAYMVAGMAKNILLVCAEIQHPVLDLRTEGRDMAVLFGDGAGALVLKKEDGEKATVQNSVRGVIDSIMGSDGSGARILTMDKIGTATPGFVREEDVKNKGFQPRMDGRTVFKNAVARMIECSTILLKRNQLSPSDIKLMVPHQANLRINEMVREKMGLKPEQAFNNIQKYGNTTAATIPMALAEAEQEGKLHKGDIVLTVAFGAGFTWGANLIRW